MKGFVPILTCGVQECHLAFTGAARHALSKRAVFTQAATPPASPAGPAEAAIPESGQFVEPPPGAGAGLARGPSLGKLSGDAPQLSKERSLEQGGAWPPERGQPIGDSPLRERTRVSVSDTAGVPPSPNPRMLKKRPSLITIVRSQISHKYARPQQRDRFALRSISFFKLSPSRAVLSPCARRLTWCPPLLCPSIPLAAVRRARERGQRDCEDAEEHRIGEVPARGEACSHGGAFLRCACGPLHHPELPRNVRHCGVYLFLFSLGFPPVTRGCV